MCILVYFLDRKISLLFADDSPVLFASNAGRKPRNEKEQFVISVTFVKVLKCVIREKCPRTLANRKGKSGEIFLLSHMVLLVKAIGSNLDGHLSERLRRVAQ